MYPCLKFVTGPFCPGCYVDIECSANLTGGRSPVAGDFSICIHCGQMLRFRQDLSFEAVRMHQVPEALWPHFDTLRMHILARNTTRTAGTSHV